MSHLVVTVDPDPQRRGVFLSGALARLRDLPGMVVNQARCGELAMAWACSPAAPVSRHTGPRELSVVLGWAIDDAGHRMDADSVQSQWLASDRDGGALDGYHLAVAYSTSGRLVVGVDPLGLFPLDYSDSSGWIAVGTSVELLSAHPGFRESVAIEGLAGILLTNGLLGGRALLHEARRAGPGCRLDWQAGRGIRERRVYELRPRADYLRIKPDEAAEAIGSAWREAVRRHCPPGDKPVLMLSGGLDSRLVAGSLSALQLVRSAVSLGRDTDFDVRAATRVSAALGLELRRDATESDAEEFVACGKRVARWEHLANGFSSLDMERAGAAVGRFGTSFWSGYCVDEIIGGDAQRWGRGETGEGWSFEAFFSRLNSWGLPPEQVAGLIRHPDSKGVVSHLVDELRREYEGTEETPAQRSMRVKMATRGRFHLGAVLHRLSANCWPVLPVFDRALLDLLYNLPAETVLDRRAEKRLLFDQFPRLAQIPVDRNSFNFERPQAFDAAAGSGLSPMAHWLRKRARRFYWRWWRREEPRRYVRLYDFDGPGWRALRLAADSHREHLGTWLHLPSVNRILPPATATAGLRDPFAQGAPRRTLLGLALWVGGRIPPSHLKPLG